MSNLSPKTSFDILENYRWSLSNYTSLKNEVPRIILTARQPSVSVFSQTLDNFINTVSTAAGNVVRNSTANLGNYIPGSTSVPFFQDLKNQTEKGIKDLYFPIFYGEKPTVQGLYVFPHFPKQNIQLQTGEWLTIDAFEAGKQTASALSTLLGGATTQNFTENALNLLKTASEFAGTLDSTNRSFGVLDKPKVFTSHNSRTVTIQFMLYNIIDSKDWLRNRRFIKEFSLINSYQKVNIAQGKPPVIFEARIPGTFYSPAMVMQDWTVENVGNFRQLVDENNVTCQVPDIYGISITLTELNMPSQNLLNFGFETNNNIAEGQ